MHAQGTDDYDLKLDKCELVVIIDLLLGIDTTRPPPLPLENFLLYEETTVHCIAAKSRSELGEMLGFGSDF